MVLLYFFIAYVIGYFICLVILANFGKALGMDYTKSDEDSYWEDWDNNATGYAGISFAWPFLLIFGFVYLIWSGLVQFSQFLIEQNEKEV
jgi:hypothetical protein